MEQENEVSIKKQKNQVYIKDLVKYSGFGDSHEFELIDKMQSGIKEFQITHKPDYGKDNATATAYFRKSDTTDNYFFNKFDLELQLEGNKSVKQTFIMGKENNFTLKEAFNLLEGRAVHKTLVNQKGQEYQSWVRLDFNDQTNSGNFMLRHNKVFEFMSQLKAMPLKNKSEQTLQQIADSLMKGNRQAVTFTHKGEDYIRFLEAEPRFKKINTYDGNERSKEANLKQNEDHAPSQATVQKTDQKNAVKKTAEDDNSTSENKKQSKSTKKGKGIA